MRNKHRGQSGQSTAMVVTMLFLLMLFVGVVVDVGQAVNRRIALQIVADTGAYTGASVMAVGLNQIAYFGVRLRRQRGEHVQRPAVHTRFHPAGDQSRLRHVRHQRGAQ
ncbi:MAG: Tad domain-containing protein [Acidobacteria bacterium]|nr:Tad domain-containing protein [Acidobacteriota bacterium]